jgi:hypothetical protein
MKVGRCLGRKSFHKTNVAIHVNLHHGDIIVNLFFLEGKDNKGNLVANAIAKKSHHFLWLLWCIGTNMVVMVHWHK